MAPNGEAHYGALKLESETPAAKPVHKLAISAAVMVFAVVGVFAMTAGVHSSHTSTALNADLPVWPEPGSADAKGPDCKCVGACNSETEMIPFRNFDAHFCDIIPEEGDATCIGIAGDFFTHMPNYDPTAPCADADGNPTGNCRAVCEFVKGRYDCWSFPCFNGGFCVDATDGFTCNCAMGYGGATCENDVDECTFQDLKDDAGEYTQRAVCSPEALCQNSHGAYSCQCNNGWEGDGYVQDGVAMNLWGSDYPPWISRPTAEEDPGFIQSCTDIDSCRDSRCQHEADCYNMVGFLGQDDYDCLCSDGPTGSKAWVGHDCETDVDECAEERDDCDPHATCINVPGSFTCECIEHWQMTDMNLEEHLGRMSGPGNSVPGCYDWPDCSSDPCQHGGTCTEGPDGCEEMDVDNNIVMVDCYACTCPYGWSGNDCEDDEDECTNSEEGFYPTLMETCHDEAFCTNVPGSFECACNAGWTGDGVTCIDADDCEFSPCAHGGTCYDCGTLCFTCDCVVGWRGTTCGTDWNECIMGIHQCNDEATCANNPGSYDCRCDPGFTGDGFGQGFTEEEHSYSIGAHTVTEITFKGCKDIDDCDPKLYNGPELSPNGPCIMGTCEDVGPNAYVCTCQPGYTDSECDMNINECDPVLGENDCHRFATCTDTSGSYICTCNEGFSGNGYSSCLDISDCYSQCQHGFCTDLGVDHFKCNCDNGWMNRKCDYDINECTTYTHECARHALCTNNDGSYTCGCNIGWSGDGMAQGSKCLDVDDCASDPCDWGLCSDEGAGAYTCACQDGYTDYNCDFDVNECYMKTHNCHVDARCVNTPGTFYCRCLSGWEGDGLTCTDLDDCDPDPCDPVHGTCEDQGANLYHCNCMGGWTGLDCGSDQDECSVGTHSCDPAAGCTNTEGSHTCACNNDYYGNGLICTPCTVCPPGWKEFGICDATDYTCVNVDECVGAADNCHEHATCSDSDGSFKCECDQNGPGEEYWGIGINDSNGCVECTVCYDGYHEVQPCTSTSDRTCDINIATGLYMLETEADDNRQCMAMMNGEWYPSRVNFGNGDEFCGIAGDTDADRKTALMGDGQAIFKISHVGNHNDQETMRGGDMYIIEFNDGGGFKCLFFGDDGKDIYPSLQNCNSYALNEKDTCPWANGGKGLPYCGYNIEGMESRDALFDNGEAIWRITPLKLNSNKYILQTASKGRENANTGEKIWECLAFEEQGAATNPSRYNWGNGDSWCGAGDWEGLGKAYGLLNNKQAVFILSFLQAVEDIYAIAE